MEVSGISLYFPSERMRKCVSMECDSLATKYKTV